MSEIAGNEFSTRYNLDYFENKAVPRYIIVIKGGKLTPTGERAVHEFFEAGLRGKHHRSLVVPLPADDKDRKVDVEMKPIEAGVQDASFNNFRKANINGILMAHRVPASKVGVVEGVALAVARDADKTFKEQVCRPEQRVAENKIAKIVKEVTDIFFIRLVEMTLTDEDTQSKIDERDLRMQVIVPNERRTKLGLPGRKGGDDVVDLKAQQAADQVATGQKSRARDSERSANATDSAGEGRNTKGEGRKTP
jgi:capsid portal protein